MYGESDVETTGGKKKRSTIALAAAGALGASAIAGAVTGAHFGQKLGFAGGLGVSKAIYLKRNKRSADGEEFALSEGMETINGVETIESGDLAAVSPEAEMPEGEEGNKGEAAAADGSVRKERSLTAVGLSALGAAHLAGAVVGGHIGKKFGFGTGLAVGLGTKKHAHSAHAKTHKSHGHAHKSHGHAHKSHGHAHKSHGHAHKSHGHAHKSHGHVHKSYGHAHKAAHHKIEHETVCNHVPVKRCTSSQQCEKVPWEKCENLPVKSCKQVPNTKCKSTPHEVCTTVTDTKCKQVPQETCQQVPKQRCVSVPNEVCVSVPETKCRKEPSEKCWEEPVQKCHQVPEEKCWKVGFIKFNLDLKI